MNRRGKLVALLVSSLLVVAALWGAIFALRLTPQLGLDLQGGVAITLIPAPGQGPVDPAVLDETVEVIRQRVDGLGVAEPEIARQGETVIVQLPGLTDRQRAVEVIGRTAKLEFRPVLEQLQPGQPGYAEAGPPCAPLVPELLPPEREAVVCEPVSAPAAAGEEGAQLPPDQWPKYRVGPVAVAGNTITDATAVPDQQTGLQWQVNLDLNGEGARAFQAVTGQLACQPQGDARRALAVVLDGLVNSAPTMSPDVACNQGIPDGNAIITTGGEAEARELAVVLRTGALPITLEPATTQSVSPTLGRSSLQGALVAGGIGLLLVGVYLCVLYRGLGLAAISELIMFGLVTYGLLVVLGRVAGFTLTLAGIAGVIVSIGTAADSSIIYRERYRDEIRAGRTIRTAADYAYRNALRTNLTGNTVSFLAAATLYFLAVGPVRGFAFTLGLSTLIDTLLFPTFTRSVFGLLAGSPKLAQSPLMGLRADIVEDPGAPGRVGAAAAGQRRRPAASSRRR